MKKSDKMGHPHSGEKSIVKFDITIDPNGYEGNIGVDTTQSADYFYFNGHPVTKSLTVGTHFFNTGATLGGTAGPNTSYIYFDVTSAGKLINLAQPDSASVGPDQKTIILKTVSVLIDVGTYPHAYKLSAKAGLFLSGSFSIKLVRYQQYTFDSGITYPDQTIRSYFNFFVDATDKVIPDNHINATPGHCCLKIKTTTAYIDPAELSEGIKIQLPDKTEISSAQNVLFVKGLLTWVRWPNPDVKYFYFVPM